MSRSAHPHPGFSASFPALRSLFAIRPFRKLFIAGSLSSFGDWLALLATTALAAELARNGVGQYLAVSGVFILRIAPAIILGPLAGVEAVIGERGRRRQLFHCRSPRQWQPEGRWLQRQRPVG